MDNDDNSIPNEDFVDSRLKCPEDFMYLKKEGLWPKANDPDRVKLSNGDIMYLCDDCNAYTFWKREDIIGCAWCVKFVCNNHKVKCHNGFACQVHANPNNVPGAPQYVTSRSAARWAPC